MRDTLSALYFRCTLQQPMLAALLLAVLVGAAAFFARDARLDASADSLILETDKDLAYYQGVREQYGADDFLIITYTPEDKLFSRPVLDRLAALRDELATLPRVSGVTTILDVPLIDSPRMTLAEIQEGTRTLADPDTDLDLAAREFQTSPIFKSLLTDPDNETTALVVNLKAESELGNLYERRDTLRRKARSEAGLSEAEAAELEKVSAAYQAASADYQNRSQQTIADVRAVMARHSDGVSLHLGGVSMIASDMIDFVRSDISLFSIVVGVLLLVLLAIAFRKPRWVVTPLILCGLVALLTTGLVGMMNWPITVVSSNYTSLTLIITLSLTVHLIVRQLELQTAEAGMDQQALVKETLRSKFAPSVYTTLTTVVSFGSLMVSGIRPVIDFGFTMVSAVLIAFLVTFLAYPLLLGALKPGSAVVAASDISAQLTRSIAGFVSRRGGLILVAYALLAIGAGIGISRLGVENRFIDYFKESTEIYQGMVKIDQELGGTTPLDVIIDAPQEFIEEQAELAELMGGDIGGGLSGSSYWYNTVQLQEVKRIHDYLESLPETGKVLSMASTMEMMTMLNRDEPLDNFSLAVMYGRLPDKIKATLIEPYMSEDGNQIRFSIRVIDSDANLRRNELLKKIRHDLTTQFDLKPEQVRLTGLLVLYNNVLQSLFESQILTLGTVFVAIVLMLLVLFRSLSLALIGVVPTLFAAGFILGLMGWLNISLDIMTITIAAITIGIGVDNTIHYTHRFREEVQADGDYAAAMVRTHGSVGRAIYYTSIIVTLGFSILALSNFVPIIYFGLFTGLAMLLALIANLTLLPLLLVRLRPKM